jgi:hypothetical protein
MELDRYVNMRRINGSKTLLSSNITADETTDWIAIGPQGFNEITVFPNFSTIATANSSDQIDFYLQTKTQDGPIYDLLNIHFANSENGTTRHQPTLWRGGALGGIRALAVTDGALLDDEMQLGVPLGTHVRIRIVFTITGTPTLTYTCKALLRRTGAGLALPPGKGVDVDSGVTRTIKRADYEHASTSGALLLVAGVATKKIRVIGLDFHTDVVGNMTVQDDNSSPVKLTGAMEFIAGGQWEYNPSVQYPGERYLGETTAGDDLDIDVETSGTHSGWVEYLEI